MAINLFQIFSRLLRPRRAKKCPIISHKKNSLQERVRRALDVETLEGRVVPASTLVSSVLGGASGTAVVGTVYEDLDSNGVRNNGENGVSGWTVYLDLDQSGTLNADATGAMEPSAVTNKDGDYVINRLQPGTYRVSEVVPSGWTPTAPVSQDVAVIKDRSSTADFFNFSGGAIVGTVWNDLDANGVRAIDPVTGDFTETGLAGWTVFLDANNNRLVDPTEPTTLTDANGHYSFVNLPPGDYEVTELLPAGWDVSPKFDSRQTATVVARTEVSQDFANFSLVNGSIQGTVWNDVNADGIRDTDPTTGAFTEPGLAGWTVFLDLNSDGVADPSEPTTLTDESGAYSFISLPVGDYEVTEVLPAGWDVAPTFDIRQTVAVDAGKSSRDADFANFSVLNGSIRGNVWNDINRNGVRDVSLTGAFTEPGLANWTIYLDRNHNNAADAGEPSALTDANGDYSFGGLQVGDYEVREVLPSGWEVTRTYSDSVGVTVYSGMESVAPDFANFNIATATPGSISGTVWNDFNGNGIRNVDPTSGAFTDPGLAGWTVFIDLNSNGVYDATETKVDTAADGSYSFTGILPGSVTLVEQAKAGWRATAPSSGVRTIALKNGENASGLDFGNWALQDSTIRGVVFADSNKSGSRDAGERGLEGVTVYLDLNNNGILDSGEPQTATSADLYYTPAVDEAGSYAFTHLATGSYTVREVLPAILSATPAKELEHIVTLSAAEDRSGIDCAAVYRPTEIHGIKFDDSNGNHQKDAGEAGVGGATVFVDLNRDNALDAGEPTAVTTEDGSYSFTGLTPGAYVIREVVSSGHQATYPNTSAGTLWPQGVSNAAVGNVSPSSITASLAVGEAYRQTISITLPNTGALTNMVDVFLLFDDTGSFVNNSPIVRAAFPDIISQLQTSLPGIDLGFGVGRFEEYANFAYEYGTGRPFILNQAIVAASTPGYMTAIQAALNRTTPGYGGDQPETDIEALYQLVTGLGFDGNNNGSVLDSGAAGLAATQLNPGSSGDVPSFASFRADPSNNVMAAAGNIGGGGFRAGALPIILTATDTGFAYQPKGETTVTGVGGVSVPISALTETSRPTTPFNSGAGFQETVTGLNALGALVIGLGTNTETNLDPRQGLEALSKLTGAVNHSTSTIANGTADPIAPGDPLYFQIASGFAGSVASGVVSAIQNAVTNVAVDISIQASDPRVKIINHTGVKNGIGSGQTATFDIEFVGDGIPHRFDLQFVRNGTNVVLGSIPVVLGTPIAGNCYDFEDLEDGEISTSVDFGSQRASTSTSTPTITVTGGTISYDGLAHVATASATGSGGAAISGAFTFTYNGSATPPAAAGVYDVVASFTSSDANYSNATGAATLTIAAAAPTLTITAGTFSFDGSAHAATATATGIAGAPIAGAIAFTYEGSTTPPSAAGVYNVLATFTSSDSNYANATGSAVLTIQAVTPKTPTIVVSGGSFTYDGKTHIATATATNSAGTSVSGSFAFTYNGLATLPTAAGVYNVLATFTSSDASYTNATGTALLTIGAATPTVVASGGAFIFDNDPHAAFAAATGIGDAPIAGTFIITYNGSAVRPSAVNSYDVVASFTSADPNYSNATGSATLTISAATPTLSVLGGNFTYDSLAHGASASAFGIGGTLVGGSYSFTYNGSAVQPTAVGNYDVVAQFTSSDPNYANATGTATLTIGAAVPTLSVLGTAFTYDGLPHTATATASGIGGAIIKGTFSFTYNGSSLAPQNAGTYSVAANFTSADSNYASGSALGNLVIGKATPLFSNLSTPVISAGTVSASIAGHLAAGPVFPSGATVTASLNGVQRQGTLDGSGNFVISVPTAGLAAGSYPITVRFAGDGANFDAAVDGSSTLTVNNVSQLSAKGIDLSVIAGAPLSRTVATFTHTLGAKGIFTATISWGDGTTSTGVISGSGTTLTVVGEHTYADPGSANIRVTIADTMGMGLSATTTSVATITSLGLAAGKTKEAEFWQSSAGQNLIRAFNGGANHTELANWLATNFPNLYGANAGSANLTNKTNAFVAAYFKGLWRTNGDGAATQVLTTALNVYASTLTLGGMQGACSGFPVSVTGLGARTFGVGNFGAAVGVPNKTKLNVFELLRGVDKQAKSGVLYAGNRGLQSQAKTLFDALNSL